MRRRKIASKLNKSSSIKSSKIDQIELMNDNSQDSQSKFRFENVKLKSSLTKDKETCNVYTKAKQSNKPLKTKIKLKSSKCQVFFCDKCDKVYDQYSELVYHERRHTGEKPFHCTWPNCKKAFSASNARVRHLRIHTGEKPYTCPIIECGKRFTYWKDLKLHKYRHTGEKPHKCDWEGCNARFFRKDDLKHHHYTHTGEKPYKCLYPNCGAAFSQKSPLNLHTKKFHKLDNFTKSEANNWSKLNESAIISSQPASSSFLLFPSFPVHNQSSLPPNEQSFCDQLFNTNHSQYIQNSALLEANEPQKYQDNSILVACHVSLSNIHEATHPFNSCIKPNTTYNLSQSSQTLIQPTFSESDHSYHQQQQQHVNSEKILNSCNFISNTIKNTMRTQDDHDISVSDQTLTTIENIASNSQANHNPVISNIQNDSSNPFFFSNCENVENIIETSNFISSHVFPNNTKERQTNVKILDSGSIKSLSDHNLPCLDTAKTSTELALIFKPVRKRANYRLKVKPMDSTTTSSTKEEKSVILKKRVTRKKINGKKIEKNETNGRNRLNTKRTIAVQTTKKSLKKKAKGEFFICDICKREFKAKHDRDCHRMTHTGEKPRACDWPNCDYRCITKSKLIRHKRKHTGERNYPCDWLNCGKKFATSRHLKEHRRSHTGEKPFKCDWPGCDKWFSRKDHIKNHRFIHTGEKPRKCPFPGCESAFIQLSPLKKHMELHKRDGISVQNRTRKRKVLTKSIFEEGVKEEALILDDFQRVNLDVRHHEKIDINSKMLPQNTISNFVVSNVPESQNYCLINYENQAVHLDYEMMLKQNYC